MGALEGSFPPMLKRFVIAAATTIFAALPTVPSDAADLERGRRAAEQCVGCHGADGISRQAGIPHIAGQGENYMFRVLCDFHSNEFSGCRTDTPMNERVPRLNLADIENIAAWYASRPCPLPEGGKKPAVAPAAVAQTCANCHGKDGRANSKLMPLLAGQRPEYLLEQLRQFASKKEKRTREHPLMDAFASRHTDAEFQELARWYAAQSCR